MTQGFPQEQLSDALYVAHVAGALSTTGNLCLFTISVVRRDEIMHQAVSTRQYDPVLPDMCTKHAAQSSTHVRLVCSPQRFGASFLNQETPGFVNKSVKPRQPFGSIGPKSAAPEPWATKGQRLQYRPGVKQSQTKEKKPTSSNFPRLHKVTEGKAAVKQTIHNLTPGEQTNATECCNIHPAA